MDIGCRTPTISNNYDNSRIIRHSVIRNLDEQKIVVNGAFGGIIGPQIFCDFDTTILDSTLRGVWLVNLNRFPSRSTRIENVKTNNSAIQTAGMKIEIRKLISSDTQFSNFKLSDKNYDYTAEERIMEFVTLGFSSLHPRKFMSCSAHLPIKHSIVLGSQDNRNNIENDCIFENSIISPELVGLNNFYESPQFNNESELDLTISGSSPARDRLQGNFDINTDFEGDLRPLSAGYDIGADEFVP